ncbi:MAG: DUF2961 domain-containing protein, partial [bacterium]|nr:DUF2961 domain-containing protein [bacterium]
MRSPLDQLAVVRGGRTRRISSYERSGGNCKWISLGAGESVTLAAVEGCGTIRHIWCRVDHEDPMYRRHMILRMYWDGASEASVECPLGDFFGQGWGEPYNWQSLVFCAGPRGGRELNCYLPMPFRGGARIEIWNDSEGACRALYYMITYDDGDPGSGVGRFHATWHRRVNYPEIGCESQLDSLGVWPPHHSERGNHVIIDTRGRGQFVGVNYYIESPTALWYGEGDDMWIVDGEGWPPSLHGTGTEDYFNTAWGPKERYGHWYFGAARINTGESGWLGRTHVYRFHVEDPVYFRRSLRGSIEVGHGNLLCADVATVGYWYQEPVVGVAGGP